jgi:hypothetical protein
MNNALLSQTPTSTHSPTSFREAWSLYKQSRAVFGGRTPESSAFISAAKAAFRDAVAPSWRKASARTEFVQTGHGRPSAREGWAMECREVGIDGVVVALFHHPAKGWAMTWWQ